MRAGRIRAMGILLAAATVALASAARTRPNQEPATRPSHDYPVQPVPFTAVHLTDVFWAPRIETNRKVTIPAAFQKCEESGRVEQLRARGAGAPRRAARHEGPALSVRRHRPLQGDRRGRLRPQRAARSEARRLRRRHDREDRRRAGARRLHLHHADDRPAEPASLGGQRAVGQRAQRQPRAVQPRPPLRGGRRALPGDRQEELPERRDARRRSARQHVRSGQADRSGRATRSPRWRS